MALNELLEHAGVQSMVWEGNKILLREPQKSQTNEQFELWRGWKEIRVCHFDSFVKVCDSSEKNAWQLKQKVNWDKITRNIVQSGLHLYETKCHMHL